MIVLHLEASNGWGGQEMRILQEALAMRDRGYEIIFAVEKNAILKQRAQDAGFLVYELRFNKKYWHRSFWKIVHILRKHKVDLVNTHSSLDAWLGGIVAKLLRRKVIRTRHLSTMTKKGFLGRVLYGWLADYVITTCESIVPTIQKHAKKSRQRCFSVPTGIIPENIHYNSDEVQSYKKRFGIKNADYVVGTLCVMRSWKGVEDLLEAAYLLRAERNIKFLLIGGGNQEYYAKKAEEMGIQNQVFFTGHLENPFSALATLNAFALLSTRNEGISQASLQAAFLGLPLITTGVGGLREICIDKKTGIEVPPKDPIAVSKAILFFKDNEERAKSLGKAAKELVLDKFTHTSMVEQIESIYQNLRITK